MRFQSGSTKKIGQNNTIAMKYIFLQKITKSCAKIKYIYFVPPMNPRNLNETLKLLSRHHESDIYDLRYANNYRVPTYTRIKRTDL